MKLLKDLKYVLLGVCIGFTVCSLFTYLFIL